jgi:hypothetical protein
MFNSSPGRNKILLLSTSSRIVFGSTYPPVEWVPEDHPTGVKWPWREADHPPLTNAEFKNSRNYSSISSFAFTK